MAINVETLSEALEVYNDRYQNVLETSSKRLTEKFLSSINQINAYLDIVNIAIGENNLTRANAAIDEVVAILNAEGIFIADPVILPMPIGVYASPAFITIPVNSEGNLPDFTNASSIVTVLQGGLDASSSYTFTIDSQVNVTAAIVNTNEVEISAISDDNGSVTVKASKSGTTDLYVTIVVSKYYDAEEGLCVNTYPSSIIIPSDSDGSNPVLTNALSVIVVRLGNVDDTVNWTFVIQAVTDVTAVIQNDNEVKISSISSDEGLVEVRASKLGTQDQDFQIPVQKQRKGQAIVDASSIDDVTIGLNSSNELYLKRDQTAVDSVYGTDLADMVSYANGFNPVPVEDYLLRSTNLRRAPSTNDASGLAVYNIESVDSVSAFGFGNVLIGPENILNAADLSNSNYIEVDGNIAWSSFDSWGFINLDSSLGDVQSDYTVGEKILAYVEYREAEIEGVYYWITGDLLEVGFNGSWTYMTFTPDFEFKKEIEDGFYKASVTNNHRVNVVQFTPFEYNSIIGSRDNFVVGKKNRVNAEDVVLYGSSNVLLNCRYNYVFGVGNDLTNARANLVLGNGWSLEPAVDNISNFAGNTVIGFDSIGRDVMSHGNLIVEGNNIFSVQHVGHEDSSFNILVGISNYVGTGNPGQTEGFESNILMGKMNNTYADYVIGYGYGGEGYTNGEIFLSSSSSDVQKSIYILEGATNATSLYTLQTLKRAAHQADTFGSSIRLQNDRMYSGTVDCTGIDPTGQIFREKRAITVVCNASGTVTVKINAIIPEYSLADFSATLSVSGGTNELLIQITPGVTDLIYWVAIVEGVITDY